MAASLPNFPPFSVHEGNAEIRWRKWISRLENLFISLDIHAVLAIVKDTNDEIKVFCEKKFKCSLIENGIIYGYKTSMYSDDIHFSALGQKNLV